MTRSDLVTKSVPTKDGKGRLYTMEPSKRIVLSRRDEWVPNK